MAPMFTHKKPPWTEKLADRAFIHMTSVLASVVSLTVLGIFFTVGFQAVFQGEISCRKS